MSGSCFSDKDKQPADSDLKKALGQKYSLWTLIRKCFHNKHAGDDVEWKYYGKRNGWLAKNMVKKRNIFFLIPLEGGFRLSFTFGAKAVEVINKSDLPESIVRLVNNSREYAEGRVIQIEVKSTSDCKTMDQLIDIKCAN
jgi:hypothetical protein